MITGKNAVAIRRKWFVWRKMSVIHISNGKFKERATNNGRLVRRSPITAMRKSHIIGQITVNAEFRTLDSVRI
jgi:hypothetical protein